MPQTPYATQAPLSYKHIVNGGTVQVKASAGVLASVNINAVTAATAATLYDVNNTGTLGTIEVGILAIGTAYAAPAKVDFGPAGTGLEFNNGLVIVTTGTCDLTIGYR